MTYSTWRYSTLREPTSHIQKLKENDEVKQQPNSPIIRETNPREAEERESGLGPSSFEFNTNVNNNPINWMAACNHKHIKIQKQNWIKPNWSNQIRSSKNLLKLSDPVQTQQTHKGLQVKLPKN